MQIPLKQGLKLRLSGLIEKLESAANADSIKTRIETFLRYSRWGFCQVLLMQIPLKQGLKQVRP